MELRFRCVFVSFLYKIWSSTVNTFSWMPTIDALKSLCFNWPLWNTDCNVGRSEVQARRSRRAKRSWVRQWLSTDRRLQYGHYDQLIRAMSMEDGSPFFNYMRMELLRIGPRIQKSDTNFRRALEQDWSWPERQERSGSVAEAPRLTMHK